MFYSEYLSAYVADAVCDFGRGNVRLVRPRVLKVVVQNDGDFVDVILI